MNEVLVDLWSDLRQPAILWQIVVLAACLAAAWRVTRPLRSVGHAAEGAWRLGMSGLKRVLLPLVALLLVLLVRPILAHWQSVNLLHLAVPLLGSLAFIRLSVYALRHVFPRATVVRAFERVIAITVWGAVALHIVGALPTVTAALDGVVIGTGAQRLSLWRVLQAVFWALLTVLVALWAGSAIEAKLMRAEVLHSSLRVAFSRVAKSLLVLLAVLMVLPLIGIDLTVLSVFGGALGVGLGFGLQKVASNYVSGFIILLDRSIRLDDLVTVGDFSGRVRAITTRYVELRSQEGREAIIPNELLMTQPVINHTHSDRSVRLSTSVQIDYRADIDAAMRVLVDAAAGNPRVLKDPPPAALLTRFADSGIQLELGFWIGDPESGTQGIISEVNLALFRGLAAAGVELAFPQIVVHRAGGASGA